MQKSYRGSSWVTFCWYVNSESYTFKAFNPTLPSIQSGFYFPSSPFSACVFFCISLIQYFLSSTLRHSSDNLFFPSLISPSISMPPKPLCPSSPVEIRLQQWTLRVMVMECIWGASSFLSPTCMQNHPNGESLAPVYTERGTSTMVTPLLSLKPLADRSAQSPPVKTFCCWIKKKGE